MKPFTLQKIVFNRTAGRLLAVACLALAIVSHAEARPPRGEHGDFPRGAEQQVARMTEALDLTDAQSAELLVILQRAEADREALRETMETQFKPDICALHDRVRSEVASVLDPEQQEQMEEHMERRAERAEGRGRGGPPWADCDV